MISSYGVAGFDWDSSTSFSGSKRVYSKVRSGITDKMKRLVTKNPRGATILGKFRLSLVGGQETHMLLHINVILHGYHTSVIARAKLHLLPGVSKVSELLSGKDLGSGTAF